MVEIDHLSDLQRRDQRAAVTGQHERLEPEILEDRLACCRAAAASPMPIRATRTRRSPKLASVQWRPPIENDSFCVQCFKQQVRLVGEGKGIADHRRSLRRQPLEIGQRQQRPVVPVHVVLEIKDLGETGAGDVVLRPGAVRILRAGEILDAAQDARAQVVAGGDDAHERPGRLRRRAFALALELGIVVGGAAFRPSRRPRSGTTRASSCPRKIQSWFMSSPMARRPRRTSQVP